MKLKKLFSLLMFFTLLGSVSTVAQTKIVTGHPDFKIKITRCEANGNTVVIDMTLENTGSKDINIRMWGGISWSKNGMKMTVAYDDDGNKYTGQNDLKVSIGKSGWDGGYGLREMLPPDIPLKASILIEGVPESATEFKRIDLYIESDDWGLNDKKPIKITNVPISREGDD